MKKKCSVCNGIKIILVDNSLGLYQCHTCSHRFTLIDKTQQEIYDEEYFSEAHKNWFLHPNLKLFLSIGEIINKYFKEKKIIRLLDIGCGKGDMLRYLQKQMPRLACYGIDVAKNLNTPNITYIQDDFYTHPFNTNFDVVTGLMIIEHIDDPVVFMQKIQSILAPSGLLILSTIHSGSFIYRLSEVLKKISIRGPFERLYHRHHLQHYTTASLKKLLEAHGFEVEKHFTHNFPAAAIDISKTHWLIQWIYRTGVVIIFCLTTFLGGEIDQTIICKKKSNYDS